MHAHYARVVNSDFAENARAWFLGFNGFYSYISGEACHPYEPFKCPGDGVCISIQYLCDGAPDCQNGYDEDSRLCTAGGGDRVIDRGRQIKRWYRSLPIPYVARWEMRSFILQLLKRKIFVAYRCSQTTTRGRNREFSAISVGQPRSQLLGEAVRD